MYFTQSKHLREMEKLMRCVTNFLPRGNDVVAIEVVEIPPPTFAEMILETAAAHLTSCDLPRHLHE